LIVVVFRPDRLALIWEKNSLANLVSLPAGRIAVQSFLEHNNWRCRSSIVLQQKNLFDHDRSIVNRETRLAFIYVE
jgi:hypothetical protein